MQEMTNVRQAKSADQSIVWDALIVSAIGALLAVLVSVPYDQVLGLSTALCIGLKCTASVAVFNSLASVRPAEMPLVYQVCHT
jgi:hypothetical protein